MDANQVSGIAAQIVETMNAIEEALADLKLEVRDLQDELGTVMESLTARIEALEAPTEPSTPEPPPPTLVATLTVDPSLLPGVIMFQGPPAPADHTIAVWLQGQIHTASPGDTEYVFTNVDTNLDVSWTIEQDNSVIALGTFYSNEFDQTCGARITVTVQE